MRTSLAAQRGGTGKTSWNEKHEKNSQRQNPELVQKAYVIMDIERITEYEETSWRQKFRFLWVNWLQLCDKN